MVGSGQMPSGNWVAVLIGVALLITFIATTITRFGRAYAARHHQTGLQHADELSDLLPSRTDASLWRCRALIVEALVVRARLSGEIDAQTYQIRMNELARQDIFQRRPQRNI